MTQPPGWCARVAVFLVVLALAVAAVACGSVAVTLPWFSRTHGLSADYSMIDAHICVPDDRACVRSRWGNLHDLQCREVPEMVEADIAAQGYCLDIDQIEICYQGRHNSTYGLDMSDPAVPHYDLVRDPENVAVLLATGTVQALTVVALVLFLTVLGLVVLGDCRRRRPWHVRTWMPVVAAALVVAANWSAGGATVAVWDGDYDAYGTGFWLYGAGYVLLLTVTLTVGVAMIVMTNMSPTPPVKA
jgi:hypothetical protein